MQNPRSSQGGPPATPRGEPGVKSPTRGRPARVLVLDKTPRWVSAVEACRVGEHAPQVYLCKSLEEARACAADGEVDLLVLYPKMPDGDALDLAQELTRHQPHLRTVVITGKGTLAEAKRAIRLGADDYVTDADTNREVALQRSVRRALEKGLRSRRRATRLARLRRLCDKLEQANREVSRQVDTLCGDLLSAYQELAEQMNNVVQTTEYASQIRGELDLEHLIRKTLEHLVDKAGPTNCAIYLPASADEYSVGGYVNYDCDSDAGELVLAQLADHLAPVVAEGQELRSYADHGELVEEIADGADLLEGRVVVSFPCLFQDESLAVIALFRDEREGFDESVLEVCRTVGPLLGEALGRVIRIHHRALDDEPPELDELPF